jgi:hypothetical protein
MAITRAQQVRQMLEDGGMLVQPSTDGKRPGYRGIGGYRGGPGGSGGGVGREQAGSKGSGFESGQNVGRDSNEAPVERPGDRYDSNKEDLLPGDELDTQVDLDPNDPRRIKEENKDLFINKEANYSTYTPSYVKFLGDLNRKPNRNYFYEKVLKNNAAGLNYTELEEEYDKYMSNRLAGYTDAMGNTDPNYRKEGDQYFQIDSGRGGDNIISPIIPEDDTTEEDEVNPRDYTGLAPRFMGSIFDFTGLAEGGIARAGAMDGGRMRQMEMMEDEDDPTGGIMDLESGRQMYFLGKLVKKAGRAIKKVAKSPIGKAALLYFGGNALMSGGGGGLSSFFGKGSFNPFLKKVAGDTAFSKLGNIASKFGMVDSKGAMTLGGKLGLSFGVPFALDALGVGKEENDDDAYKKYMEEMRLNVPATRARRNLAAAFDGSTYNYEAYADGGRTGYQEGGDAEPVAKKTMPLLDMNGMEKDYREDGGFVPIGRMERADDVPARLSKNEFVFTADAVRNAGEGDIDKGAEVMYNMMKNLESGGEVSEESQGLDGAREMFQTSKRLEEVL